MNARFAYDDDQVGEEGPHSQFCRCSPECRERNAFHHGDFTTDSQLVDDDADYRIGGDNFFEHFEHVVRYPRDVEPIGDFL